MQTLVAGQQAENLLDFDDAPAEEGQPSGLAATTLTSTPAAANLLAGTSTNPLDDLVSIFGSIGVGGSSAPASMTPDIMSPSSMASPVTTMSPNPLIANSTLQRMTSPPIPTQRQTEEDLLGLF